MNIQTEYIHPPIPLRQFDWVAVDVDTYEEGEACGYGATEEQAIANLLGNKGATCTEVADELIGRGFSDWQVAHVMEN